MGCAVSFHIGGINARGGGTCCGDARGCDGSGGEVLAAGVMATKNIAALLPKLTSQERIELLSALKHLDRENYGSLCVVELMLVDPDDATDAVRLYGSHALASKLQSLLGASR
jgi:hypothetical protein